MAEAFDGVHVMHVIGDLRIGGAETSLLKLVGLMDPAKVQSHVVVLKDAPSESIPIERFTATGATVHQLKLHGLPGVSSAAMKLWRLVRAVKPDVVQGWMYHGAIAALASRAAHPRSTAVVWNIRHSLDDLDGETARVRAAIRSGRSLSGFPAAVVYNSKIAALQHESYGYSPKHRHVIPNGFDADLFAPSRESREWLRSELGVPQETMLVGHVGRFHPSKDHAGFLQAAREVLSLGREVHFVLAGQGVDGSNPEFVRLTSGDALLPPVHALGVRSDIPRIAAGLDLLVVSSVAEAFPNVLGEAMACGVPCVTTDVGDSAWIVGDTGLVVAPRSPEKLAAAIVEMLALSAAERRMLGERARARVMSEFSLARMAAEFEALFLRLAGREYQIG